MNQWQLVDFEIDYLSGWGFALYWRTTENSDHYPDSRETKAFLEDKWPTDRFRATESEMCWSVVPGNHDRKTCVMHVLLECIGRSTGTSPIPPMKNTSTPPQTQT